ncbi:MAG TPA: hypothetical protein VET86_15315 [Casimicrobiaceae bacterium]|nr:hypothetical protein [Casimicrobiaceae bacterium]
MNEFANRARASLWWSVPLLVALALIAWETDLGRAVRRVPPPEAPVEPKPVVTALLPEFAIPGGTAARTETVQRTLFNPTRRAAPVLAADASKARMQRGQFALTGTLVVGGKNTAFLRENAGGRARRVLQGETINGLLVAEVKPDRVRLALGDESEELVLRVAPNPKPTAQLPAPAPVAPAAAAGVPPAAQVGDVPSSAGSAAEASLAERRRAARAAQAAIQAQTSTPGGNPLPAPNANVPAPVAPANAPAPAAPAAGATSTPDPRWLDVYRQMQTRNPNRPK